MYAAQCIGDGGEGLLEADVMPPHIIGGILLPLLGAIPDAVIIAVSGISGSVAEAEEKIDVGVGTLAGSTIMLLCVAFSSSLFVARCDVVDGEAKDETLNGKFYNHADGLCGETQNICGQLFTTGVTYDRGVLRIKRMMMLSSLGYLGVQIPSMIFKDDQDAIHISSLAMVIFSFTCLVIYFASNVFFQEASEHHEEHKELKRDMRRQLQFLDAVEAYQKSSQLSNIGFQIVDRDTETVNEEGVAALFDAFDIDDSGYLDSKETAQFSQMVQIYISGAASRSASTRKSSLSARSVPADVAKRLAAAQERSRVTRAVEKPQERQGGRCKPSKKAIEVEEAMIDKESFIQLMVELLEEQLAAMKADDEEEPEVHMTVMDAIVLVLIGTALVTVFSDSMVDAINSFGKATGIPNFTMGFIVCPYISNASELLSSMQLAGRKKKKNASVAFAQIYAGVIMNNCLCNAVFFLLIFARGLTWNYGVEVFSILAITWTVSILTCDKHTIKLWIALAAMILYPLALIIVEVLHIMGIK